MDDDLTLHDVAAELGVHYMTAYRYVRLGILPARKEGREWRVRRSDLDRLGQPSDAGADPDGSVAWDERLLARIVVGDEAGAWWVIEAALAAGTAPGEIVTDVIASAMSRVGDLWESGDLGVEQEHTASAVALRLLGRLGARFARRGSSRGLVILGGTASETHGLPLSLAAETLRMAGFEVLDLGPRLPADAFAAAAARAQRLVAIGVGVTAGGLEEEARASVGALQAAVDVPIILGGAAIPSKDRATELGADEWASSAKELLAVVEQLVA